MEKVGKRKQGRGGGRGVGGGGGGRRDGLEGRLTLKKIRKSITDSQYLQIFLSAKYKLGNVTSREKKKIYTHTHQREKEREEIKKYIKKKNRHKNITVTRSFVSEN